MKTIMRAFYAKPLAVVLIATLLTITSFVAPAQAMFIPAASGEGTGLHVSADRAQDLARVEAALESKVIRQKLMDYGLSPDEAMARVNALSDQQLHDLAAHTDSVQAGGDVEGFFFALVLVAVLVVVLVFLVQGRIEVK